MSKSDSKIDLTSLEGLSLGPKWEDQPEQKFKKKTLEFEHKQKRETKNGRFKKDRFQKTDHKYTQHHQITISVKPRLEIINIIKEKFDLGLPLDESVSVEFENSLRHKNFIFLSGLDLIYEFFNIEVNFKNDYLSKSVQWISKYPKINKIFRQIADKGALI